MIGLLLALSAAQAQTYITEVGPVVGLEIAGTWGRALHTGDGWVHTFGTADSYFLSDLEQGTDGDPASWSLSGDRTDLQDRTGTKDHAIVGCPDGSYLHVASANVTAPNDTAYAWRLGADFSIQASVVLEEGVTERMHNDMVIMCSRLLTAAVFPAADLGSASNVVFPLNDALDIGELFTIDDVPRAEGGALLTDAEEDVIYQTGADELNRGLVVRTYDADWNSIDYRTLDVIEEPLRPYWPQRLLQLGDHFLLAFVARDDRQGAGDLGDIYIAVLDKDWTLLERVQVTTDGNAMRPWMERYGTQILVSFDADTQHSLVEVRLDAAAFGLSEEDLYADTAWSPDDDPDASGDSGAPIVAGERGGCGRRRGAAVLVFGVLLGLWRQRRPWQAL